MNIAYFKPTLLRGLANFKASSKRACSRANLGINTVANMAGHVEPIRPLRVLRVFEAGQKPSHVGRMVISGRMADVCAELDRLAAFERAH
ncbi:MAG: hypothetical protein RJB64_404 [Pseudomonadota bacterium]